jgi:beta-lactamase regulating signal transducer with metallopeptidase domain
MMNWLYYLLEANLYLAILYGFYRLSLHRETFYTLNRYFLITATLISLALPLCKVSSINSFFHLPQGRTQVLATLDSSRADATTTSRFDFQTLLYGAYLITCVFFLIRMLTSLLSIYKLYVNADKRKIDNIVFVELRNQQSAFSFFNILFIHPNIREKHTVLKHEMVHIKQHHSADILLFELIQIVCWFSPIVYLIRQDIKLLHEYIADELTTASDIKKHEYAMFLIENSFGVPFLDLSNQIFNHSLMKRRIKMLNKEKSGRLVKFRLLLLAPLTAALLSTSSVAFSKDYAVLDLMPKSVNVLQQDTSRIKHEISKSVKDTGKHKVEEIKLLPPKKSQKIKSSASKKEDVRFPLPKEPKEPKEIKFPEPKVTVVKFPPPKEPKEIKFPEPKVTVVKFPPPKEPKEVKFPKPKSKEVKFPLPKKVQYKEQ